MTMASRLTPLEIQKHRFSRKWKGLDPVEVGSFLDTRVSFRMRSLWRCSEFSSSSPRECRPAGPHPRARGRELGAPPERAHPEGDAGVGAAGLRRHPGGCAEQGGADRQGSRGLFGAADAQRVAASRRDREGHTRTEAPARERPARAPEDARALQAGDRDGPAAGRAGPAAVVHAEEHSGGSRLAFTLPRRILPRPEILGFLRRSAPQNDSGFMTSLDIRGAALLATPLGSTARRGREQGEIFRLRQPAVRAEDGFLAFVGTETDYRREYAGRPADVTVDATGRTLLPGFVDAHTHPVWVGDRAPEIGRRLAGESYASIAASGGGILATVRATRVASDEELSDVVHRRVRA